MLLDSNIVIYSTQSSYGFLRAFIAENEPVVSALTKLEVLGYHKLNSEDTRLLTALFDTLPILPISMEIISKAIELRQQRKMTLGDSIIAATAIVHNTVLATRNVSDFNWIKQIKLLNPIDKEK